MREIKHNTPEQVRAAVAFALEVLDDLEVPEDLRPAAFTFAASQTLAKQIFYHPADQAPLIETVMPTMDARH